ncbi:MAG TPA: adenylate/guanylate cyclase domain-containing protein [Fimbriimonadaceae bacterium]|nr:adenylate/guanylate cyclase domain-containing protein [Fimbriimonadaceae bacterium]
MDQARLSPGRKLAAIMFTDMVGYSTLVQKDESAALNLLPIQARLFEPVLFRNSGRLIRTMGDGAFIEFGSAVAACKAALEIQHAIAGHNEGSPESERFQIRIGIHLGDVEVVGDDLLGHGVNVAARLEPEAEPGGVCISEDVARQVRGKIPSEVVSMGRRTLKGISDPMPVYSLAPTETRIDTNIEKIEPRIAVLPLVTQGGDLENEFFGDGITEEILWALAKVHSLRVVSRTSCFALKGASMRVKEIGTTLGVDYILEGSVRRAGNRVRIAVQLVKITDDRPIWSDRYDRELEDIFAIQEEITQSIVDVLQIALSEAERGAIGSVPTNNLRAYDQYLKGCLLSNSDMKAAVEHCQEATRLDPSYAKAHAALSYAAWRASYFLEGDGNNYAAIARQAAERAIELDSGLMESQLALANMCILDGRFAEAEDHLRHARTLDPRSFEALFVSAQFSIQMGNIEQGCEFFLQAGQLRPDDYQTLVLAGTRLQSLGDNRGKAIMEESLVRIRQKLLYDTKDARAYCLGAGVLMILGQIDRAKEFAERAYEIDRFSTTLYNLACFYSLLGDKEKAIQMLQEGFETGLRNLHWILQDPEIDPLRDDPRVQEIINRMESKKSVAPN